MWVFVVFAPTFVLFVVGSEMIRERWRGEHISAFMGIALDQEGGRIYRSAFSRIWWYFLGGATALLVLSVIRGI